VRSNNPCAQLGRANREVNSAVSNALGPGDFCRPGLHACFVPRAGSPSPSICLPGAGGGPLCPIDGRTIRASLTQSLDDLALTGIALRERISRDRKSDLTSTAVSSTRLGPSDQVRHRSTLVVQYIGRAFHTDPNEQNPRQQSPGFGRSRAFAMERFVEETQHESVSATSSSSILATSPASAGQVTHGFDRSSACTPIHDTEFCALFHSLILIASVGGGMIASTGCPARFS